MGLAQQRRIREMEEVIAPSGSRGCVALGVSVWLCDSLRPANTSNAISMVTETDSPTEGTNWSCPRSLGRSLLAKN